MIVLLLAVTAAGCARMQARTPQPVAMSVPPPPPRVAIPVVLPEPWVEPPAPPAAEPTEPARPRVDAPSRSADRPQPAPAPPVTAAAPEPPAPVLQTTTNVGALEQRASRLLREAEGNLDRVSYRDLNLQARAQYDRAIGFIRNARSALNVKNYNYAEQLAAKAAAVARELIKG
jgi:hypothetical protein